MSSTCKSFKTIISPESLQPRRDWLLSKITDLHQSYNDVLKSFKERLDAVVNSVIQETNKILDLSDELTFFRNHYEVGINIEKACHELFEIKLVCCNNAKPNFVSSKDCNFGIEDEAYNCSFLTHAIEQNYQVELPSHHSTDFQIKSPCTVNEASHKNSNLPNATSFSCANKLNSLESSSTQTDSRLSLNVGTELDDLKCFIAHTSSKSTQTDCTPACNTREVAVKICQTGIAYSNCVDSYNELVKNNATNLIEQQLKFQHPEIDIDDETPSNVVSHFNCQQTNQVFSDDAQSDEEPSSSLFTTKDSQACVETDSSSAGISELENNREKSVSPVSCDDMEAPDLFDSEIDILLLHDIAREQEIRVIVTDAVSPGRFTVQPKACLEQLKEMQRQINDFYSSKDPPSTPFRHQPDPGTVCAACFALDGQWYRARVTKKLSVDKVQVLFIDYGNYSFVELKHLRSLFDPMLAEVPPFSVTCSLSAIKPASSGPVTWSSASIKWFRSKICDRECVAKFLKQSDEKRPSIYPVQLFYFVSLSHHERGQFTSVAETLVMMGHAVDQSQRSLIPTPKKQLIPTPKKRLTPRKQRTSQRNSCSSSEVSFEDVLKIRRSSEKQEVVNDELKQSQTPSEEPSQSHTSDFSQFLQTEDGLSVWDPMKDDHDSERNKYNVNVDNACVAIEKVNPRLTEVCKYFAKGDCWKGKHCPQSHVTDPDVLYQTEVFLGNSFESIELEADEYVAVEVTTEPQNDDFYVHVIKRSDSMHSGDGQKSTYNLRRLTEDMKTFYKKFSTRQAIDSPVCMGEVYVILYQTIHCRVSVLDVPSSSTAQVFLLDFGIVEVVPLENLLPMQEAFMHLPVQAVLCTYDKSSSLLLPEKNCGYYAQVGALMNLVDSPVHLNLLRKL